jgi:thiamine-phosphate pyrophosphorylase
MPSTDLLRGFYAVLDRDDPDLARMLVASDGAGAQVLQVRIKPESPVATAALLAAARTARRITREHGALLIINDRLDVALAAEADGVHLGQDDLPLAAARRLAGDRLLIGVSTHDLAQVRAAVAGGADYLGYGPVFSTATKRNPDPVQGLEALAAAVAAAAPLPVVAIGGITPATGAAVAATGAAAACVIAAVNHTPDPAAAGRQINTTWPP